VLLIICLAWCGYVIVKMFGVALNNAPDYQTN